jgi:isomerase DpgB
MSVSDTISVEVVGDGALTPELTLSVNEFCDRVEDAGDDTVAVIHVGPGRPDAGPWPGEVNIHLVSRWERALRRVERLGAVTVCVADGFCGGPALDVLLTTDFRLATTDALLAAPAGGGQFWPGMVLHRLAGQIGVARTRQLLLHSPTFTAVAALELGLVNEVVDDQQAALRRAVATLSAVDGAEFAIRRRLLLDAPTTSFEDALGVHLAAADRALRRLPVAIP